MSYRIEISTLSHCSDPRGLATLEKIKQFTNIDIKSVQTRDVYTINADWWSMLSSDSLLSFDMRSIDKVKQRLEFSAHLAP